MSEEKRMLNFGYANCWKETPDIINNCKHKKEVNHIRQNLTEYTCKECGYKYLVDSSD